MKHRGKNVGQRERADGIRDLDVVVVDRKLKIVKQIVVEIRLNDRAERPGFRFFRQQIGIASIDAVNRGNGVAVRRYQ